MGKRSTLSAGNVFYEARIAAASWNDKLNSREGAAEITGLDRTRLAYIELGTINPHPEEVLILADAYNAPELHNYFCSHLCPLGQRTVHPIELNALEASTLRLLASFNRLNLPAVFEDLIEVAAYGATEENKPRIKDILLKLDDAADKIQALKLFFTKHFSDRTN